MTIDCKSIEMRKVIIINIFILLFNVLVSGISEARVKGKCKDCHTMHYSYEGKEVTFGSREGPFPVLTKGGCIGCHGQEPEGQLNIITKGKTRIPQIIHKMDKADLAGGNYYYVADGFNPDYSKGHNVRAISIKENTPMNMPPGFKENVTIPGGLGPTYWLEDKQLTCSGTWGCHGNRTFEDPYISIYGAHHEDDSVIDGSTTGKSYRFLYGINGKEHKNWEYMATVDDHNGYSGDISHDTMNTISYLCGECHVKFHPHPKLGGETEVGQAYNSIWYKHPTDIAFGAIHGNYAYSEYQDYTVYSLEVPVAYENPTGKEQKVDENSIVMCLSCHRAHASPFPDILRWDYTKITIQNDLSGQGCLKCHTRKGH